MKYICCQPAIDYYSWQVEIMINNFVENGIPPEDINIICSYVGAIPQKWKLIESNNKSVNFFFYKDNRSDKSYIPSIYFNMLKQHLAAYPELESEVLFLHDCDILFTKPVDFSEMEKDAIWYLSDTVGYIGTQYILSKGEDVYLKMCSVIGIDPEIPKARNSDSGGAQYIVKNTTSKFWEQVEADSLKLYKSLCDDEPKWTRKDYPIQKWTAGMWSLLWNAWKFGHETKVDRRLDFCWATDLMHRWDQVSIFHNAGVTLDKKELFFKGKYIGRLPYDIKQTDFNDKFCSYNYVKEVIKTKKISCLI